MAVKNWGPFLFIVGYHLLLLILLPLYIEHFTWSSLIFWAIGYFLGGVSITAGYHRLFSHKAYQAHPWLERIVLFLATLAFQASALVWCHDHRLHHKHVDTDEDPYSIKKGFWYAHVGWIFANKRAFNPKVVRDLEKNPRVMFQKRHMVTLSILSNAAIFGIACCFIHPWAALYAAVLLRIFTIHHSTWFINSLAHTWGARTYARELTAVDNAILAVLTFGEGYHNYHHAFASDYRNGIRWYHYDVTKWIIWASSKLGLARQLRATSDLRIRRQLVQKDKELILGAIPHDALDFAHLREQIEHVAASFEARAQALSAVLGALSTATAEHRRHLLEEIRQLQDNIRHDWKQWKQLTHQAGQLVSLPH